ncbi:MAG: hypothetical protein JXA99_03460 [Candidatus Lokiarchaeota archaeon]|nr:hypothetical protein [Candidatus Lokiarchaeota archaeon]
MKRVFTSKNEKEEIEIIEKKYKLFELYHDEFLFRSYYAYSILKRMRLLKEVALKAQFEGLKNYLKISDEQEILFSSFITREYIYFVMPFLNTIFILQDRIMILIGEFLNINDKFDKLPKYYYDYKKKKNKIISLFPKPLQTLLINYWENHGKFIRQYRNLDQHQYQLYYHSFYKLKPNEEYVIYLPDEINRNMALHEIKYKNKIVALDFFEKEFKAFHDFVEEMLEKIKIQPSEIQPGSSFRPLEHLKNYKNGDIISTMIIGNETIVFRINNENDPDSEAKHLTIQKVPNKVSSFNWKFR